MLPNNDNRDNESNIPIAYLVFLKTLNRGVISLIMNCMQIIAMAANGSNIKLAVGMNIDSR